MKKESIEDPTKRKKVRRTKDGDRVRMYTGFMHNDVLPLIMEAHEEMNVTAFNGFVDRLCNLENKASCDQDDIVKQLHKGRDTQRKVKAAETSSKEIYVSALMRGMMKLSHISRGKEHHDILEDKLFRLERLKMHHIFENKESVTKFVPLSTEMQALMPEHNEC